MIYKAIKGSIIPLVIEVDLGTEMKISGTNVGLEVTAYCEHPKAHDEETKTVVYTKTDTNKLFALTTEQGGGNGEYLCLIDTSTLDCGRLCCGIKVTYTDSVIGKNIISIPPVESDVLIIEPYTTASV